jgi:amino acid transporter
MVGTGIFSTPSSIIAGVGSVGAALTLWVLGLAISFCGLFVWFELGCLFPRSGGEKVYLQAAYPRPRYLAITLFAVQAVLLSSTGKQTYSWFNALDDNWNTAGGCVVFAENAVLASGHDASDSGKRIVGIMTILAVTIMHSFVPRWGVRINVRFSCSILYSLN